MLALNARVNGFEALREEELLASRRANILNVRQRYFETGLGRKGVGVVVWLTAGAVWAKDSSMSMRRRAEDNCAPKQRRRSRESRRKVEKQEGVLIKDNRWGTEMRQD